MPRMQQKKSGQIIYQGTKVQPPHQCDPPWINSNPSLGQGAIWRCNCGNYWTTCLVAETKHMLMSWYCITTHEAEDILRELSRDHGG